GSRFFLATNAWRLRSLTSTTAPGLRMTDMRRGRLPQDAAEDNIVSTLSNRVAHLSPSSSGAKAQ
ncbi:MAG TPA: hypothetical protein VFW87_13845, partial [Pirellulales bacterium]|nr:hypothetical protein [Pirellulales bacterium]